MHDKDTPPLHTPLAKDTLRTIFSSPEFMQHKDSVRRLGGAAIDLHIVSRQLSDRLKTQNKGYDSNESRQVTLVGLLPNWIKSQQLLDTYSNRSEMPREEKEVAFEAIIEFNHVLRQIIDSEQFTKMSDVKNFVMESLLHMRCDAETAKYAANSLSAVLNGMRHEIAAESVLSSLSSVDEVRGATPEEERHGKDIVVSYYGKEICLDIKASENSANEAATKRSHYSGYNPLWSGFRNGDFGDSLILDKEQLDQKKSYYENSLRQLYDKQMSIAI